MGELILISRLQHLQVEAGVSFDLLQRPHYNFIYHVLLGTQTFDTSALGSLFLLRYYAAIRYLRPVCQEGDHLLLMDKALTLGLSKRELSDLNLV